MTGQAKTEGPGADVIEAEVTVSAQMTPVRERKQLAQRTRSLVLKGTSGARARLEFVSAVPPMLISFILAVAIPSIAVIFYVVALAADQYESEIRLAIRSQPADQARDISSLKSVASGMLNATPQIAGQDAYIVAQYLKSRAAMEDIHKIINLREIYTRPEADFWARLKSDATAEDFQTYWANMVSTSVEASSGILTAKVRAFRADDAQRLAEAFIQVSERLVNDLSNRARRDALSKAEDELRRSEGLLRDALGDLREFRDAYGILDPLSAATTTTTLLLNAMAERIQLQGDLFVMNRSLAPDAPTTKALTDRIDAIDHQIEQLKNQLTSQAREQSTISAALVRYEQLDLQRLFAEKLLQLSQNGLERARLRAEQKQLYLSVFLPPYMPEEPEYPRRIMVSLISPLVLVVLWGIAVLMAAALKDGVQ